MRHTESQSTHRLAADLAYRRGRQGGKLDAALELDRTRCSLLRLRLSAYLSQRLSALFWGVHDKIVRSLCQSSRILARSCPPQDGTSG